MAIQRSQSASLLITLKQMLGSLNFGHMEIMINYTCIRINPVVYVNIQISIARQNTNWWLQVSPCTSCQNLDSTATAAFSDTALALLPWVWAKGRQEPAVPEALTSFAFSHSLMEILKGSAKYMLVHMVWDME